MQAILNAARARVVVANDLITKEREESRSRNLHTVQQILTYYNNVYTFALPNYGVLLILVIAMGIAAISTNTAVRMAWSLLFVCTFVLQILLCLWIRCMGISIVWSVLFGAYFVHTMNIIRTKQLTTMNLVIFCVVALCVLFLNIFCGILVPATVLIHVLFMSIGAAVQLALIHSQST